VDVKLTVVAGPHSGQVFPLADRDTFLVGRTPDCHFRVNYDDPFFSPRHLLLEVNAPRCRVIDVSGGSGIKVNGRKVESANLKDGDEVRAGQTVFHLAIVPSAGDAPTIADLAGWTAPAHLKEPANSSRALPKVPGFVLDKEIGCGGMGIVYRATREADGGRAAIKVIQPALGVSARNVEQFLGAVRALGNLRHSNVVECLDGGSVKPLLYIVMEYVSGPNAQQVIQERGPLPARTAILIMAQALTGLAQLHARGQIHGDVKPSNLLIGKTGDRKVVKVADFGLARAYEEAKLSGLTMRGDVGGSPAFFAPEQIARPRDAGPAADQFAAAATLYYFLTGSQPYDLPKTVERAFAMILCTEPVPIRTRNPTVDEGLAGVIHRALGREPADRYPDIGAFERALRPFAGPGA
jgi:eukaryotic-like serine/threonine-protein kinase